jgi:hypothetical protein
MSVHDFKTIIDKLVFYSFLPIVNGENEENIHSLMIPTFVEGPRINPRMAAQSGAFLFFSVDDTDNRVGFTERESVFPTRLFVFNKESIQEQLAVLAITKENLFPGMDSTAERIKKQFS